MTAITTRISVIAAISAVVASLGGPLRAAETTLKTVGTLQPTNTVMQSFLKNFLEVANMRGKGVVQLKWLGSQEIVPPRKAAQALKRGQFDVMVGPTAYYIGTVPEGYAMTAANQGPHVLRKNGAWKLLQKIYKEKAGSHLLAWGESRTSYNTYMNVMPKLDKDGVPDLTGIKMRASGTYRPLFRALGAATVNIKTSEMFTALQRGTVQGFGFPSLAVVPNGFHKITKYRITPDYYQTNQVVTLNLNSWAGLNKKQKDLLNNLAVEYESTSVRFIAAERIKEEKLLSASGVKDIKLTGKAAAKYLAIAHAEVWKALKKRSQYHDQLKSLMYVAGKPDRIPLR